MVWPIAVQISYDLAQKHAISINLNKKFTMKFEIELL